MNLFPKLPARSCYIHNNTLVIFRNGLRNILNTELTEDTAECCHKCALFTKCYYYIFVTETSKYSKFYSNHYRILNSSFVLIGANKIQICDKNTLDVKQEISFIQGIDNIYDLSFHRISWIEHLK